MRGGEQKVKSRHFLPSMNTTPEGVVFTRQAETSQRFC